MVSTTSHMSANVMISFMSGRLLEMLSLSFAVLICVMPVQRQVAIRQKTNYD